MTSTEQPDPALCDHIRTGAWPLRPELVLDDHLGATDAVVSCRECGRPYLMEMLDWRGHLRVMRMSVLDATQAARPAVSAPVDPRAMSSPMDARARCADSSKRPSAKAR
jgi:hypothetical protein